MTSRMLHVASVYQVGAAAAMCLIAAGVWPHGLAGVAAGGLIIMVNFWLLRRLIGRITDTDTPQGQKAAFSLVLGIKFVVLMGLIALSVTLLGADPVGLALGMASLFVAVGCAMLHTMLGASAAR